MQGIPKMCAFCVATVEELYVQSSRFLRCCVRGSARNFPTERLELPIRGLKWLKYAVFVHHFAKLPPARTKISSDRGLDASDKGAVTPSGPPLAPSLGCIGLAST